jgi:hypothetical protein
MNLTKLISATISANLGDSMKLVQIVANQPSSQVSSQLNMILKQIKKLHKNDEKIEEALDALNMLASVEMNAAQNSLFKELNDNLGILDTLQEDITTCDTIIEQLNSRIGARAASAALKEVNAIKQKREVAYKRAYTKLTKLANDKKPKILMAANNETLKTIMVWMDKQIEQYNKEAKTKIVFGYKNSTYFIDNIKTNGKEALRFVRYIPVTNVPTTDGKTKDIYIAFSSDMISPKQSRGNFTSDSIDKMMLNLTVSDSVVRPGKLPKLYACSSIMNAQNILEYFAQRFNLVIFGSKITGNAETRREKVREKLQIAGDDAVKVSTKGPFITLIIPKSIYRTLTPKGELEPTFEKKLFKDVQIIIGLNPAGKYNADRLRLEKLTKLKNGSVSVMYRKLEMSPDKDLIVPTTAKDKDGVDIAENPEELNNDDWIAQLREEAKKAS